MAALQAQLSRAVSQRPPASQPGLQSSPGAGRNTPAGSSYGNGGAGGSSMQEPLTPPGAFAVHELRKAVAAGWIDQVCSASGKWVALFVSDCLALTGLGLQFANLIAGMRLCTGCVSAIEIMCVS